MAQHGTANFGATERRRPTPAPLGGPPLLAGRWVAVVAGVAAGWAGLLALLEVVLAGA